MVLALAPQPLDGAGIDLEGRHPPPGPNAFEMKAGDDSILGKAEGETRVLVKRQHSIPFQPSHLAKPSLLRHLPRRMPCLSLSGMVSYSSTAFRISSMLKMRFAFSRSGSSTA